MKTVVGGRRLGVRKSKRYWLTVEGFSVLREDYGRLERRIEILKQVQNDGIDSGSRVWGLGSGKRKGPKPLAIINTNEDVIKELIRDQHNGI